MSDNGYNGWPNYATWRINLEVFGCDDSEQYRGMSTSQIADILSDQLDEYLTMGGASGLVLDYARSFVSDVDFYCIAEHLTPDAQTCEECDEELDADGDCLNEECPNYWDAPSAEETEVTENA